MATSRRGALREPEGVDAATQRLLTTNEGTMAETYLEDMRRRRTAKFQAERDPEMGARESARLRRPMKADVISAEAAARVQRVLRYAMGRVG